MKGVTSAVEAGDLSFSYGDRPVLNDLSLTVPQGIAFGMLGANGSGKTTLVRLLAGLLQPATGQVRVLGHAPEPGFSDRIGYMPQLNALYMSLTVRENVDFFARMYGVKDRRKRAESVDSVLDLVELADRRDDRITSLSGGMRQRVSLAVALVHAPPVLLLDEPTVGLDPELRATFWEHFGRMTREGTTILVSSHTMDDASHCDRLGFLRDGRFIAEGTPDELRATTGSTSASLEDAFLHLVRTGVHSGNRVESTDRAPRS
ncbi:MAG: ABC transporter ATP-binding protein [Chloroflexi bacterium]|nr:ABC transporter ATP-binding protein [Chloroflexota bacterium]